jgi:aldehyde:ferredoxin oxidoreductase
MHDPRLNPGLATSYKMDATPGRHTQMSAWTVEGQFAPPGLVNQEIDKYNYSGKGQVHKIVSGHFHSATSAGMCMFAWVNLKPDALSDSLTYTTGHKFTVDDVLKAGDRIATLRIGFNLRDGFRNVDIEMPGRVLKTPPPNDGPIAGVDIDLDTQVKDYLDAMGWDSDTGVPKKETLRDLDLDFVAADLHA